MAVFRNVEIRPVLEYRCLPVDVTRGPTLNHPGDNVRVFAAGRPEFFIDGVEVTEAEFRRIAAEWGEDI